jgi:hypothetical protein
VSDISGLGFQFRGYPVTMLSPGAAQVLGEDLAAGVARALREARDTAEPDEPSG